MVAHQIERHFADLLRAVGRMEFAQRSVQLARPTGMGRLLPYETAERPRLRNHRGDLQLNFLIGDQRLAVGLRPN